MGAERRSLVDTIDGIEVPAVGRWEALPGALGRGAVVSGALDLTSMPALGASLELVFADGIVRCRLADADRLGNWSFVGRFDDGERSFGLSLLARYHGVFAGGARPVALLSLVRATAPAARRRDRRATTALVGDINLSLRGHTMQR